MRIETVKGKAVEFALPEVRVESFSESKYEARIVTTMAEFESVLMLRRDVFRRELSSKNETGIFSDYDEFDARSVHLLVTDRATGKAVGTYRLNAYKSAGSVDGFYASSEFELDALPVEMLERSVELGRACISKDHRNSRVLFLLWRVMAAYMEATGGRYLFGCCSVFTQAPEVAANVLAKLRGDGHVDESIDIRPRPETAIIPTGFVGDGAGAEIPPLVNIYMRIGAKVCGEPAIDRAMKTVDFFVIFDLEEINRKYRKMFFG
jgi:putative hemolysin